MPNGSPTIDTVRVGGPVEAVNIGAPGWRMSVENTQAGISEKARRRQLPSGAWLDVVAGRAWVEASVPKLLRGVNYPAAPLPDVVEAATMMLEEASGFVRFSEGDPLVNRLDVVSDLPLEDQMTVGTVISTLAALPVMGAQSVTHHLDPTRHKAQTLSKRTKSAGSGTLYDKLRESGNEAARGVLRFEGRERRRSLRAAGIERLSDLDPVLVDLVGRERFKWCGFDTPMLTDQDFWQHLLDARMYDRTRLQVYGFACAQRDLGGISGLFEARRSDYRWRKFLHEFGVLTKADQSMRIDYDEGLVMAA